MMSGAAETGLDCLPQVGSSSVADIASSLSHAPLLCFAGAGVSRDSGFPAAEELRDEILNQLEVPADASAIIADAALPFELVIQTLAECSDVTTLYRIYRGGVPSPF